MGIWAYAGRRLFQSVIVLLIAAPPLVRTVFRLPTPGTLPRLRRAGRSAAEVTK